MLTDLQNAKDLNDLAKILGYKASRLSYVLYVLPDAKKYRNFKIKKKDGSDRDILAPHARLKILQRKLSDVLYQCVEDFPARPLGKRAASFGYSKKGSIVHNASFHSSSRHVIGIDIENFFGSIHIGRVIGFFIKDRRFNLHPDVAKIIGQISCHNGSLPQGSPCSPIISNLIGGIIDSRLSKLASKNGFRYSRYVDDLALSTNLREIPVSIFANHHDDQGWRAGGALVGELQRLGFSLRNEKSRLSSRTSQQVVTGLVCNRVPNVPSKGRLRTRVMCHHLFNGLDPYRDDYFAKSKSEQDTLTRNALRGRLAFQYYVDHFRDERSPFDRRKAQSSRDKTYRRFLAYEAFFPEKRPTIIVEGDTDRLYIKAASEALKPLDTRFIQTNSGKVVFHPRFLNRSKSNVDVLGFNHGVSGIGSILNDLHEFRKKYPHVSQKYPVVIVTDNDAGLADIAKGIKRSFNVDVKTPASNGFHKIYKGVYLVPTPLNGANESTIEDLLDPPDLQIKIAGKSFGGKKINPATEYGKAVLAAHIWKSRKSKNFLGFQPLLDAIDAAFSDFGYQ